MFYLFQKAPENINRTVNNSSLPIIIKNDKIHFPKSGIFAKLFTGPTDPIAGPTFPIDVATEPIAVSKSTPIAAITSEAIANIDT